MDYPEERKVASQEVSCCDLTFSNCSKLYLFLLCVLTKCLVCFVLAKHILYTSQIANVKTDYFENLNLSLKLEGQVGDGSNISPFVVAFF